MGFLDDFKKWTKPYSDDDEDEYYDELEDEYEDEEPAQKEEPKVAAASPRRAARHMESTSGFASPSPESRRDSKVVNINTTTQLQVVLVRPENYDGVSDMAHHLRERKAILLNLEGVDSKVARRIVDFLSGCAFALDGKLKKVATYAYLITPYNVEIVGDLVSELENNGMYF